VVITGWERMTNPNVIFILQVTATCCLGLAFIFAVAGLLLTLTSLKLKKTCTYSDVVTAIIDMAFVAVLYYNLLYSLRSLLV
jgi:hypothetical protein